MNAINIQSSINKDDKNSKNDMNNLFDNFLKDNIEEIKRITPKSPMISKDDEWINEIEWDELYHNLKNK